MDCAKEGPADDMFSFQLKTEFITKHLTFLFIRRKFTSDASPPQFTISSRRNTYKAHTPPEWLPTVLIHGHDEFRRIVGWGK